MGRLVAAIAAALQLAALGARPGTLSPPASPWLATIALPQPDEITQLTLGEEQLDLVLTRGQPTWLRFTASRTGPVFVQCIAEGGGTPHLLLVDGLGFPVRAQADQFPNRRFIWAHSRAGASSYLALVPPTSGLDAQVLAADATSLAQGLDPITASGDALDLSIRYTRTDPCYRSVSLPAFRPYAMTVDVGPRPVDVLLAGPDGEVVCERFAATRVFEATVACASDEPHLLVLAPLFPVAEQRSAYIHLEPLEAENGSLEIRAAEPKTLELPRVGATRTAVAALQPGLWTVELTGDQYADHLRLSCGVSGATEARPLAKTPGQAGVSATLLLTEPGPVLLSVTHVSGPGRAHCTLSLEPERLPSAPDRAPATVPPGWAVSRVAAGRVYRVRPPTGVDCEDLLFCEPGNGSVHRSRGLILAGGDLILRPIEGGILAVRVPTTRGDRLSVSEIEAPPAETLPGDRERAIPLADDGPPVDVVLTQDCQEAWLRLDAQAGTQYEVISSDQIACDLDLIVLPADGPLPVWSDGEGIDRLLLRPLTRLKWVCPETGPYLLRATPHGPLSGSVACAKLSARVAGTGLPVPEPCSPADTPAKAPTVALGVPLVGRLDPWHDGYLRLGLPAGKTLSVDPEHWAFVHVALRFLNAAGEPLGGDAYARSQPEHIPPLTLEQDADILVHLANWSDYAGYFQIHLRMTDSPAQ